VRTVNRNVVLNDTFQPTRAHGVCYWRQDVKRLTSVASHRHHHHIMPIALAPVTHGIGVSLSRNDSELLKKNDTIQ